MADTFHLVIASVGENKFDGAAASATIPASAGEVTILPHHEALVTTLKKGEITVKLAGGDAKKYPIEGGVLEISNNRAVVLL